MLPSGWIRSPLHGLACPVLGVCTKQFHSSSSRLAHPRAQSTRRKQLPSANLRPPPLLTEIHKQGNQGIDIPLALLKSAEDDGILGWNLSTSIEITNNCITAALLSDRPPTPDTAKLIHKGRLAGQLSILLRTVLFP